MALLQQQATATGGSNAWAGGAAACSSGSGATADAKMKSMFQHTCLRAMRQ
jgi:hypothetical protein